MTPDDVQSRKCSRQEMRKASVTHLVVAAAIITSSSHAVAQSNDEAESARRESPWYVRIGMLDAIYHPSATIATSGVAIPGEGADVRNNMKPMFYMSFVR